MSKQGWRAFLEAEGVDDWVVLHGGATAVFRVGSLAEAARLAEGVAGVSGLEDAGGVLTLSGARLTVRLDTRPVDAGRPARRAGSFDLGAGEVARRDRRPLGGSGGPARDLVQARCDRRRLLAGGARLFAHVRRQRGRPARPRLDRLDAGASRGQTAAAMPCMSTSLWRASMSRRGSLPRSLPEAASLTTPRPRRTGSSPTAPATRSASLHGRIVRRRLRAPRTRMRLMPDASEPTNGHATTPGGRRPMRVERASNVRAFLDRAGSVPRGARGGAQPDLRHLLDDRGRPARLRRPAVPRDRGARRQGRRRGASGRRRGASSCR